MPPQGNSVPTGAPTIDRLIGDYGDASTGQTMIVMGALHGNEPAGMFAAQEVFAELERRQPRMRGRLLGVVGNRAALAEQQRFLVRDMNRRWARERVAALLESDPAHDEREDAEQRALLEVLRDAESRTPDPLILLDLHTTSGACPPFCCMADALRNRPMAFALGVPVILGLEEVTDGTLMGYLGDYGHSGIAFEAGQHEDPETKRRHVAAIWLTLVSAGLLEERQVPDYGEHSRLLRRAAKGKPQVVEIVYRHAITPEDKFAMEPGYTSFQRLRPGQVLAKDRDGDVRAATSGRILLPLYQGLGEDGFFIARDMGPARLAASVALRRLRLDALLAMLPGVQRATADGDNQLEVQRGADVGRVRDLLFLCGFRQARVRGDRVVYSRRRPDADGRVGRIGD